MIMSVVLKSVGCCCCYHIYYCYCYCQHFHLRSDAYLFQLIFLQEPAIQSSLLMLFIIALIAIYFTSLAAC